MTRRQLAEHRREPQTRRGESTRDLLLDSAIQLLSSEGYQSASVAGICRDAGVSNSSFYQYYSDKFDIYREIVDQLSQRFVSELKRASTTHSDPLTRFREMNRAYFEVFRAEHQSYQIFRESEFIDQTIARGFYKPIVDLYQELFSQKNGKSAFISEDPRTTAWMLKGLQEFTSMRWLIWGRTQPKNGQSAASADPTETTAQFVLNGLGFEEFELPTFDHILAQRKSHSQRESSTRRALLNAAERHFGMNGYHNASVSDITRDAGVAQGTFYIYFPSKLAIFSQLVQQINEELIDSIRGAIDDWSDRKSIETLGFQAFFKFIREHPNAYRIVREAEFVDQATGQGYYRRIAAGYVKGLQASMERGEIHQYPPETLAYCLMGIGHFAGMKWLVWDDYNELPPEVFAEIMRFISNGVLAD